MGFVVSDEIIADSRQTHSGCALRVTAIKGFGYCKSFYDNVMQTGLRNHKGLSFGCFNC